MIKVLSIAGSDPSSGAGIQADLKTFQSLGAFGMALPAALTAQNSRGVTAVQDISPNFLFRQLETLLSDIKPDAVKTGMLLTRANIRTVARAVKQFKVRTLVVDPVLRSSSGKSLLQPDAMRSLQKELFPLALLVTPNIPEAEALTGVRIADEECMDLAAERILAFGPAFVLIKGGHGQGPATDILYSKKRVVSFSTVRRKGDFHGTGCLFSAAITVFIGAGYSVEKAVEKAKQHVDRMLKNTKQLGKDKTRYFQF